MAAKEGTGDRDKGARETRREEKESCSVY